MVIERGREIEGREVNEGEIISNYCNIILRNSNLIIKDLNARLKQ